MTMTLAADALPKDPLTEREVLAAARSIEQLRALREVAEDDRVGTFKVAKRGVSGETGFSLTSDEVDACLAVLIERHTVFITGLGIEPDKAIH